MMNNIPVLELLTYRRTKYMIDHPEYLQAFSNDLTNMFLSEMETRMNYNLNFIIEIVGETGTGKSEAGFWFNFHLQKGLKIYTLVRDNYAFSYSEAEELVKKHSERWTIQIDEQIRNNFGSGSKRELSSMQDIEDTQRAEQLNFIFISPTSRVFHTGVHYIIRTWFIDYVNEVNYCLVFEPEDNDLKHPIGFIRIQRLSSKIYRGFLSEYVVYKKEFNKTVQNKTTRVRYYENMTKDAKVITSILEDKDLHYKTKKSILAYITIEVPEYASKYTIGDLSKLADMVKILLDK